jgi:hypothetical protein
VTREDMLHAEVSRRLAAAGVPNPGECATEMIRDVRRETGGMVLTLGATMAACPNEGCGCVTAALIYNHLGHELLDAS